MPLESIIRVLLERDSNLTHHGLQVHPLGLGSVGPGRVGWVFYSLDTPTLDDYLLSCDGSGKVADGDGGSNGRVGDGGAAVAAAVVVVAVIVIVIYCSGYIILLY